MLEEMVHSSSEVLDQMPCSKAPVFGLLLDHSKGFGGKYGVEKEKVDRSALGYDYKGETEKHQSQRGGAKGHTFFGFYLLLM